MQRNQFGTKNKAKILHRTVNATVLDIPASFRTARWSDLSLYTPGQLSVIIQWKIQGYKLVETPTKHKNEKLAKLVYHICRNQHYQLITYLGQLIMGELFFSVG